MPPDRQDPKLDLIVRGGRVIDPASGIDGIHDVAVKDGKIAQVAPRMLSERLGPLSPAAKHQVLAGGALGFYGLS